MGLTPEHNFAHAQVAVEESESEQGSPQYPILEATKPGEKPRVVVPGSGWAACRFLEGLDVKIYDVVCISPRNHMVFTPLLASTFVGTLEFRLVAEPIIAYDKLDIASGAETLTFGIKGVKEHAFFLREVTHAQEIRKILLLNLMLSENPSKHS
ncbi:internal alternative NAD(P)H-ubiquinone oxidoreductase A1, mitochondrial-like [Olea europaea subsp. europaea]|uniref:Internal alternative NAD(P)H-ubiquinone oxidoreductase A1, mitochondrial-like n=1 Tax=Olea europaea subsp. europaea TaxID=158383 RepID=A0A8S0PP85_OLEEU|nr:internal alternative NAD(P)H-ubiquinone oxidoreductase A1, mitochondrial-like [Olea europaea subsp. europaea]